MSFNDKLKKLQGNYKKSAEDYETMFVTIPPGEYDAKLSSVKLGTVSGGKLCIKQVYVITNGSMKGKTVPVNTFLEGKDAQATTTCFSYARKFIDNMGYEIPETISEIPDILAAMNKDNIYVLMIVTKSDNPDWPKINLFPAASSDDGEEGDGEEGGGEEGSDNGDGEGDGAGGDEDEEFRERVVAFAITWDVPEINEESTTDEVREAIAQFVIDDGKWESTDFQPEEIALLEDELQLKDCFNKPKPPPKTKKSIQKAPPSKTKTSTKKSLKKSARR